MNTLLAEQKDIALAILVQRHGGATVVTREEFDRIQTLGLDLYAKGNARGDVLLELKGSPIVVAQPMTQRGS